MKTKERVGSGDPLDDIGRKMRSWRVEGPYLCCLPFLAADSFFNLFPVFLRWYFGQALSV